jgi:hypothetical protein
MLFLIENDSWIWPYYFVCRHVTGLKLLNRFPTNLAYLTHTKSFWKGFMFRFDLSCSKNNVDFRYILTPTSSLSAKPVHRFRQNLFLQYSAMFDEYYTEWVGEVVHSRLLYERCLVPISAMAPITLTVIFVIFPMPSRQIQGLYLDRPRSLPSESFPIHHLSYNSNLYSLRHEVSHRTNHRRAEYCN